MAKTKSATKGGSKRDKPPALDQYKVPIIGLCLSLLAYQMFKGMMAKEIKRVDMTATAGELELREVFFGEETGTTNYAVLCYPESAVFPVSSVFQEAANDGSAPCQFRLMDCDASMPFSEAEANTVTKRFNLNKKTRPVVFVSGAVGPPKQVPAKFLKTGAMLTKALKNLLEPKAEKIETTQDLRSKCLDKDICALMLKGGKVSPKYAKEAMLKLVVEYPKVTFAAVDSSVLYVKGIEAEFLPELTQGIPRFIVFQKTSGGVKVSDSARLKTTAIALEVDVAYGPMSNLVASVVSGSAAADDKLVKVATAPTIKTRTKKLEKSEHEKRRRRQNKGSGGSSDSSDSDRASSSSGDNDGSREGRKAERDRRRAEHQKNNPNYKEKTPEEIKEMERKRRIRMEEEANKWNMDAEGDEGEDGSGGEYLMDDEDYDDEESLDDEEDGEDVMDLD